MSAQKNEFHRLSVHDTEAKRLLLEDNKLRRIYQWCCISSLKIGGIEIGGYSGEGRFCPLVEKISGQRANCLDLLYIEWSFAVICDPGY